MDFLKLTHDKLNVTEISELVTHESCGAVSLFIGTTRDNFEDKKVVSLEYEAYEAMALKAMKIICDDVREKWNDIKHIAIYHRLGLVKVCEASIVVALSSPHRVESMQAVQHTMDKLKASVPIWKKEIYSQPDKQNNTSQWKENKESNKRRKLDLSYNEESMKSGQKSIHDFTPNHLVQIKADNNEIQRRITSFIAHKRSLLNNINKKDFILKHSGANNEGEFSCARIDAMLSKRKDSKSHLRVHRVTNEYGPLTKMEPLGKEEPNVQMPPLLPPSMSERIDNCEKHLSIGGPVPKDIYSRLKAIEDRILELESISPEYAGFWNTTVSAWPSHPQNKVQNVKIEAPVNKIPVQKQKITLDDVNSRIEKLQKHIQKQSKIS